MATENKQIVVDITTSMGSCLVESWLSSVIRGVSSLQVPYSSRLCAPQIVILLAAAETTIPLLFLKSWICDTANQILVTKGSKLIIIAVWEEAQVFLSDWTPLVAQYGNVEGLAALSPKAKGPTNPLAVYPETLYYTIVAFSLCSLYFSTLLINLNTREFVQGNGSVVTTMTSFASALRGRSDNDTIVLAPMHKRGGSGREVDVQVCSSRIPETQN
ncbi:hypothetical protein CPB85DRAFT_1250144 [Mucidula mucida]|nr:hypothetical protein CPB85DRAFT_1250144 [Mucidula mucida]